MTNATLPPWAIEIRQQIASGQSSVILLHGNVRDFYVHGNDFLNLKDYLFQVINPGRDTSFAYDAQAGLQFGTPKEREEFFRSLSGYDAYHGTNFAQNPPRDPGPSFALAENLAKLRVMDGKSVNIFINYLEHLIPVAGTGNMTAEQRFLAITIDKWAQNPLFVDNPVTFFLVAENLARVDEMITRNPFIPRVFLPHPGESERRAFIPVVKNKYKAESEMTDEVTAKLTAGLSLLQLSRLFAWLKGTGKKLDLKELKNLKKHFIETECHGLLEFVEPNLNLDMVAGHTKAKAMLRDAATAIRQGMTRYLPMGYLITGPVGTGKTFLVSCLAGEIGIPVVKFLNFRSQWQGVTEANLEKIINLLKAAHPVVVMIDEADAFLGNRQNSGDSGTSARVFASLAAFMGDTSYRGKILWFLMTSRPDLLPVDMKRQGRAEEHIALFHPQTPEEDEEMFRSLARKNGIASEGLTFSKAKPEGRTVSGADIEAMIIRAALASQLKGEEQLSQQTLDETAKSFLSPNYPLEMELQTLVAIRECTNLELIPETLRKKFRNSDITARISELLSLLREG